MNVSWKEWNFFGDTSSTVNLQNRVDLRLCNSFIFFLAWDGCLGCWVFFRYNIIFFFVLKYVFFLFFICNFEISHISLLPIRHTTLLVDISLVWMHSISCDFNDWLTLREILKCKKKNCKKKNYYTTKFWSLKEVKKIFKKNITVFWKSPFLILKTIPTASAQQ